jgi:calcium-dependent protein kinase
MGCNQPGKSEVVLSQRPQQVPPIRSHLRLPTRRNSLLTTKLSTITEKYQIVRALGSDSIGTLFLCKELPSECLRTIREINKHNLLKSFEFYTEYNILKELDHPNIMKIYEACETTKNFYIVLENISGGTLLRKFKKIGYEAEIARFAYELFGALNYMHKQGIVHSNICGENVVLSSQNDDAVVKVIGFINARKKESLKDIELSKLSLEFCSPEVLENKISEKSDVWSTGVLLYTLLTTKSPFPRVEVKELVQAILAGNVEYHNSGFNSLSKTGQDLVKSMFIVDFETRPSFEELLSHPWFAESKQTLPITFNIAKKISVFKVKCHIARCLLDLIATKLSSDKKDYTVMKYFKSLDLNNDGKVSREEILTTFEQIGVNVTNEIDFIMENLDYDSSGFIDYTELILALTNWKEELKVKNLSKIIVNKDGDIALNYLLRQLPDIEEDDLECFKVMCSENKGVVSVENLKKYLKSQVVFT